MARGNGKIFYDAPNRGSKRIVSFLNDAPASNDPSTLEDAGNGFLMRQGYTIVWCGWQGDLMPQENWLVMGVPVATNDGKEITRKSPHRDRRREKRNQISAAQRRRARQELRSGVARQDPSFAHGTGKILWTTYSHSIFRMGIRFVRKGFANRQRNNQAEQRRALPSLRLQTRPYLRVHLSGKESIGSWLGLCRRTRPDFFLALRNEGREGKPNPLAQPSSIPHPVRFDNPPLYLPPSRGETKLLESLPTAGGALRAGDFSGTLSITVSTRTSPTGKYSTPSLLTSPAAAACF